MHVTSSELELLRNTKPVKYEEPSVPADHDLIRFAEVLGGRPSAELTTLTCTPGQVICREGEEGDALYLIRTGTAAIVKGDFSRPLVLAHRGSGDIIGEMALLENLPRSATVVALEPMSLVQLGHEDFLRLMLQSPAADVDILRKLSRRLRATDTVLAAISHSENQLNGRVTELTSENRQLQELQQLRSETMDLVIHDLRNPLQGITAALDLLQVTLPKEVQAKTRKFLTYINANCARLQHLVDSLIDISRMETGEVQLTLEPADLRQIVYRVIEQAAPSLESAAITVETTFPASLPYAAVDRYLLERVIANLLDNAAKFTPSGGRITISGWHDKGELMIALSDTGVGIPPEQREHVFERFARGANARSCRAGGFGLGLTFCRLATEAHGGRIWVEEGPNGVGCRFLIALPIAPSGKPGPAGSDQDHA